MKIKPEILKLADDYTLGEKRLVEALNELKNAGDFCNCEAPEFIELTVEEEHGPLQDYPAYVREVCLACGGEHETMN